MKIKECPECVAHAITCPILEACASVALDNGKSLKEVFRIYMSGYHFAGHDVEEMERRDKEALAKFEKKAGKEAE